MRAVIAGTHRTISSKMTQVFSGLHIAFAELSSDSKARVLFTKQVKAGGGSVMVPRPSAFFGGKGPLPDDVTHIVVESQALSNKQLKKKLNCEDICPSVHIVHTKWLIESVGKSAHLDEAPYTVQISDENDSATNQKVGAKSSDVASSNKTDDISRKKRKASSSSSSSDPGPSSESVGTKIHPIIPNPIAFPDFVPVYGSWQEYKSVMYKFHDPSLVSSSVGDIDATKAAVTTGYIAFDMDGTVITPKSGQKFGKDETDWIFWDKVVPDVLLQHHREGKRLAIISNQNGIVNKHTTKGEVQRKVDCIIAAAGVPMDFICAAEDDGFKKPRTGMWDILRSVWAREGRTVGGENTPTFLYVGDAAGRPKENTRKKDFSDTDLKMALNAGIQFETPEKFFLKSTHKLHCNLSVEDSLRLCDMPLLPDPPTSLFTSSPGVREIVLLVSPAACGKSTLSRRFDTSVYCRVNQDKLRTLDKCIALATEELKKGMSIVVDNTNIAVETRAKWIALAKIENVQIRCIVLKTSKEVCFALAALRLADPSTSPEDRREISRIVIHSGYKYLVHPTEKENFNRIDEIQWSPVLPPPSAALSASLAASDSSIALEEKHDITLKLVCSYLK